MLVGPTALGAFWSSDSIGRPASLPGNQLSDLVFHYYLGVMLCSLGSTYYDILNVWNLFPCAMVTSVLARGSCARSCTKVLQRRASLDYIKDSQVWVVDEEV